MTNLASVLLNRGERGETPGILNLRDHRGSGMGAAQWQRGFPEIRTGSVPSSQQEGAVSQDGVVTGDVST